MFSDLAGLTQRIRVVVPSCSECYPVSGTVVLPEHWQMVRPEFCDGFFFRHNILLVGGPGLVATLMFSCHFDSVGGPGLRSSPPVLTTRACLRG